MNIINLSNKSTLQEYSHRKNNSNSFSLKESTISENKKPFNEFFDSMNENKKKDIIENIMLKKYYWCELPNKIKQTNPVILEQYEQNKKKNPKLIENSLYGNNTKIYDKINRVVRFWGNLCNYVYPIIKSEKFKKEKKLIENNKINLLEKNNLILNKINQNIKLPKLFTNSSKNNFRTISPIKIKRTKSVMEILTKRDSLII